MRRPFVKPLVYGLIGLGVIGFAFTLITDPAVLLRQAGYIFLFINTYRSTNKRPVSKSTKPLKKKKNNTHLTVIEGKKGKKKNRAFF